MKTVKRIVAAAACLLLILGGERACFALEYETVTVRVGFFAFDGYHEQYEAGLRAGYGYEILQRIAGYAGLRYEYVGYDRSWSEMQDMLASGEIDLLTSAQKTPERERRFDFSSESIGTSCAILTVKAGDSTYIQADYANWSGIRVGMIRGNSRNDSFAGYASEKGFSFAPVYFESTAEMVEELKRENGSRKIDAVLTSNLRKIENEWVLAQFDSSPFYIMVRKGNRALLRRIDSAISQMDACESEIRANLMDQYYTPTNGDEIAFTPEERAYIQNMRNSTLKALVNPDRAPYSWLEDGEYRGILCDAAREMIARSGLNIDFIEVENGEAYLRAVERGEADIRFDAACGYNQAEKDGDWLTAAYLSVPLAKVYRKNAVSFTTAAIPANRDIAGELETAFARSGVAFARYPSVGEAVAAVIDGKQDMALLPMDSATMAMRDDITNKLAVDELFGSEIAYAAAVHQNQSPVLYAILSKVVASFGAREIDAIRQSYAASLEKPFTLIGYFYDYPMHVLVGAVAVLSMGILVVVLVSLSRRRRAEYAHLQRERAQNELLKDALNAAEKAGAAKSQFLSRMSHEMRTPLNAIIGFIELSKGADPESTAQYLASSDLAAKQLLNVINDVLDMSSIESGKLRIARAPFDFKRLLTSLTDIFGAQCRQKGVAYETKMATLTRDWLVGDEFRLNQILMNLLGNAVKFTAAGHVWLTVSQTREEAEQVFLRFMVTDTGCGMSDEMKERLFKPFEQESVSTAQKYGGSGLGLSIVKNLTGMMGGSIRVESRPGEGSAFIVDLPFGKSDAHSEARLSEKASALRVLVADDEKTERDYMSALLSRMGVRHLCVSGGKEALEALAGAEKANEQYNVCLIDWRMPDMNGVETAGMIRKTYGNDMIVIIASAYDFQQAEESARAAGVNRVISKPIYPSSLFDLLMALSGGEIAKGGEATGGWDFSGKRVLLAEDNALNQIVARGYLAKYRACVDVAENGRVAVDKFLSSAPGEYDAILMDIQMPEMDGFEAARAVRAAPRPDAKTIPIIAQSADAFNEDIAKCLSAGMNAHVSKPIKPDLLAKALSDAFENARGG